MREIQPTILYQNHCVKVITKPWSFHGAKLQKPVRNLFAQSK